MAKQIWKPGTVLYPLPVVMVSCGEFENKSTHNIVTIAWTGTINTNPPMTYISLRPTRYSYDIIKKTNEFVINLTNEMLTYETDFAGVRSGKDINKFEHLKLTPEKSTSISAPSIKECPVNIECKVFEIKELGSHHMFLAEVVSVKVDEEYFDKNGKFHFDKTKPICYSHGSYFGLGKEVGKFGYSVKKKETKKIKKSRA